MSEKSTSIKPCGVHGRPHCRSSDELINEELSLKNGAQLPYEDHPIVSNLFFEDSTRTHKVL